MTDDAELLRLYAEERSEQAFGELVKRYVDLVYSAAIRRVGNDTHLAEDVAQTVFTALARKARAIPSDVVLGGWLYRHACLVAAQTVRSESRRRVREDHAATMNALNADTDPLWEQLAPLLDEALQRLGVHDRDAIVLRYFQGQDLRGVGTALGVGEEAARKRVSRALEKLREHFKRRGLTLSTAALAALLAGNAVTAAPSGVAASISAAALAGVAVNGWTALTIFKFMSMTKLKIGIAGAVLAAGVATPILIEQQTLKALRQENQALATQNPRMIKPDAENRNLSERLARAQQATTLSQSQLHELLRLRGEVGLLRKDSQELARLRVAQSAGDRDGKPTGTLKADSWADVGMDTPDAALQTFFWAARHRQDDLVHRLIRWQKDDSVPEMEGLEDLVTNLVPATIQLASELEGLRIVSQSKETDDTARMQVEFASGGQQPAKTAQILLVKEEAQWKPVFHLWSPHQGSIIGGLEAPATPKN